MLTRLQAKNMAVNIGHFPLLSIQDLAAAPFKPRPGQSGAVTKLTTRISKGKPTLIQGAPGVGKTYMASMIAFAWYERQYSKHRGKAYYYTLAGLMRCQKDTYGTRGSTTPLELAQRCGLLVLDEITPQSESVFDQRELRDLIDTRYRNLRATILITNLATEHLPSIFDGAVLDRILEGDSGIITLTGESHRH